MRFLRNGENFAGNLLLFPTVKNFQNRFTVDEVIAKSSTPRFFETQRPCTKQNSRRIYSRDINKRNYLRTL